MAKPHVRTTRDQSRQIGWIVRRAGTAAKEHDAVIQNGSPRIFVLLESFQEISHLLAQKQVVLRKLELPILILRMREIVMSPIQSQLQRECVADSHSIFSIEHERHRSSDVRIKGKRN